MTYRVFDDKYANVTTVVVEIGDVNDNAPQFDSPIYFVLDLVEEEQGISKSNPKKLLTVSFGILLNICLIIVQVKSICFFLFIVECLD